MKEKLLYCVPERGSGLFEPEGTVLPVKPVEKALADVNVADKELFTLLQLCPNLDNPKTRSRLVKSLNLTRPIRTVDALKGDLDSRVEKAVTSIKSGRRASGLGTEWSHGMYEDYLGLEEVLSEFWSEEFLKIGIRYLAGVGIHETTRSLSRVSDVVLKKAVEVAGFMCEQEYGRPSGDLAVVVTGSYGRRELLPYSDVDICWVYSREGKTEGVDRGKMFDNLSVVSNGEFFSKMEDLTEELLSDTGISEHHTRGPETLDIFRREMRDDSAFCMDMLNSSFIYDTGGMFSILMKTVADEAYNPKKMHGRISKMIKAREMENPAELIESELFGVGHKAKSLKYCRGGSRCIVYLNHMGQLLDSDPPDVKIRKNYGAFGGLVELTKLPAGHPLRLRMDEVGVLRESAGVLDAINLDLRLRDSGENSAWNPISERDFSYLGKLYSMPAVAYEEKLDKVLEQVDSICTRVTERYKKSRHFVR